MTFNRVRLLAVCMLAAFVISGFLAPYGLLVGPIADALSAEIGVVGSLFSFFTGGIFFGYIAAFFVFARVSIKSIVVSGYIFVLLAVGVIFVLPNIAVLSAALTVIGFFCSLTVCGSVTLISQTWDGKERQSALVAQDAAFNGGGMFFTAITGYLLAQGLTWQSGYVPAATFALAAAIIALFTRLTVNGSSDEDEGGTTEWNAGIILVGALVLIFMAAKLTIIVWAPQYLQLEFDATPKQAGDLMANIFRAAFIGSLIGTYVVSKIRIHYFLAAMILAGVIATFTMLSASDLELVTAMGYLFGLSVSATFNSYMAFALGFVDTPNHRHASYMLLAGAVGSGLGPVISGQSVIATESTESAILMAFVLMAVALIGVIIIGTSRVSRWLKVQQFRT